MLQIKTQGGIIVDYDGTPAGIEIKDAGINSAEDYGGGPFMVYLTDRATTNGAAYCLGVYETKWQAEEALDMIPQPEDWPEWEGNLFTMPTEAETLNHYEKTHPRGMEGGLFFQEQIDAIYKAAEDLYWNFWDLDYNDNRPQAVIDWGRKRRALLLTIKEAMEVYNRVTKEGAPQP